MLIWETHTMTNTKRKPLSTPQLRKAIGERIARINYNVSLLSSDPNPQVVTIVDRAKGELAALELIADAIDQRTVYFIEH
jgi:hypothetical protein